MTGLFFSGHNYVKIGFGGNVTIGKNKRTFVWPAMFFSGFKLQPEKITTEQKNVQVFGRQLETGKSYVPIKKGTVVSSRWLEGKHKTQHTL
jgi:hypothetical protein